MSGRKVVRPAGEGARLRGAWWAQLAIAGGALGLAIATLPSRALADDAQPAPTYTLRYRFAPGEELRWQVQHQTKVRTTISGSTQTVETQTRSLKVWKVLEVTPEGQVTFENSVRQIELTQDITGREQIRYNSQTDSTAPPGFESFAASVGQPLFRLTMSDRGEVSARQTLFPQAAAEDGQLTIPLPQEAIAVGHVWSVPHVLKVPLKSGEVKSIETRQRFALEAVEGGRARIAVATQILNPLNNPEVQVQVVQRCFQGHVEFDLAAGRIVTQQMDLDEQVVGFAGQASSMHYLTRFTEQLLPEDEAATARRAGPAPPPLAK